MGFLRCWDILRAGIDCAFYGLIQRAFRAQKQPILPDLVLFTKAQLVTALSIFIGALLQGDARYAEARPLVEAARCGELQACTTAGVLSEVYGALTWEQANPPHSPEEAGVMSVYTYDVDDWIAFESDGIRIAGPKSSIELLREKDQGI